MSDRSLLENSHFATVAATPCRSSSTIEKRIGRCCYDAPLLESEDESTRRSLEQAARIDPCSIGDAEALRRAQGDRRRIGAATRYHGAFEHRGVAAAMCPPDEGQSFARVSVVELGHARRFGRSRRTRRQAGDEERGDECRPASASAAPPVASGRSRGFTKPPAPRTLSVARARASATRLRAAGRSGGFVAPERPRPRREWTLASPPETRIPAAAAAETGSRAAAIATAAVAHGATKPSAKPAAKVRCGPRGNRRGAVRRYRAPRPA